ncbi:MAG: HAD-IIA family hydrolase [Pigmentiphaga sp.]
MNDAAKHGFGSPAWTASSLVKAYERVRPRLPPGGGVGARHALPGLGSLMDRYDVFVFDAFGVLNAGDHALPGAIERWRELRTRGRTLLVVSNAANQPKPALCAKYQALGFDLRPDELVSSRDAVLEALRLAPPRQWGVLAPAGADLSDLPVAATLLGDDPRDYARAEGFLWLGSAGWSAERQALLRRALREWPRPLWVANPDLVAPRDHGFSLEPGYYATDLEATGDTVPRYFGKPYPEIYQLALSRLAAAPATRSVLMLGDTLHTDVLGARIMGWDAGLLVGPGASQGLDLAWAASHTGLAPDYVLPRL